MLRYADEKDRAYHILDLTSLTVDEFEQLVVPFEQAFVRHMQSRLWRISYAPPALTRPMPIHPCQLPRIGCCLFSAISRLPRSKSCTAPCLSCPSQMPTSGSTCCSWCSTKHCAILAMLLPVISKRLSNIWPNFELVRPTLQPFFSRWHRTTNYPPPRSR